MIDQLWFTGRLRIRDSREEDLPELERVLVSNTSTLLLDGIQSPDPGELRRWMVEGDLPPGGQKERHRIQTISRKDNDEVVGYLSAYHGYPDPETFYIASLFIRQGCQGCGFGGEVVDRIPGLAGLAEYPAHRLVVTVRNWGAVRFWVRHGFTSVVNVIGSIDAEEGENARLELVRDRGPAPVDA